MKKLTILLLLLSISIFSVSCVITGGIEGSKHVTTESRTIHEPFTGIKVSQGIDVQLKQDKTVSLNAEMDDNLHDLLITEVSDGVLEIYFDKNVAKRKASTIYLSMPIIESIKTSSGAEVNSTNTIKTKNLVADSSSGSEINLRVEATNIESEASSGSEINLKGTCNTFTADSSSGSEIDADELIAQEVIAEASSGSSTKVQAVKKVTAKASSGGSIKYMGNPEIKEIHKSSGGSVHNN